MDSPARDPFERIYRRYVGDVYRFALAVVRNPVEAEDVTQTTFLNAYRAFERGDRPRRVNSWLIAIAHNAIRSRRRWSVRRPSEVPLDDAIHALAVPAEDRATVREVLEVLGQLPETQRAALAMRELEGRSYREIAEAMGLSIPAVESLIARARRTLRTRHQNLRGLTVVQLPRALRMFLEQGDTAGSSPMLKAAVALAAAGALAGGGAVTGKTAGASKRPVRAAWAEPSRALVAIGAVELRRPQVVRRPRAAADAHASSAAAPRVSPPLRRTGAPAAGGTTPPSQSSGNSDSGTPTAEPTTGTVSHRPPEPPTAPTLPTLPALPSPLSSVDPTIWQPPAPPQLPTLPQPPTPPGVPQVPAPSGIKIGDDAPSGA
jgi:RNA polymerase sigma factor (sigma-70 family)